MHNYSNFLFIFNEKPFSISVKPTHIFDKQLYY